MYELTAEAEFAAAHNLRGYQGLCENLHGHNWKVEAIVRSPVLNDLGMVMDFKDLKGALGEIMVILDHKYLNDIEPFDKENPTTERLAHFICEELEPKLPDHVAVQQVRIWESARSCGAYIPMGPKGVVK